MTGKTISLILLGVLLGVLLGGILGSAMPEAMLATGLVGKLYVNALALVAIVMVLVGFPLALAKFGDLRRFDNSSAGSFVMTVSSAIILVAVGVVLVRLVAALAIGPHGLTAALPTDFYQVQSSLSGDYVGLLLPEALFRAVISGSYLGWVLFAMIAGLVLPSVGTRGRTLQNLLEDLTGTMTRIAELLFVVSPIAMLIITSVLVAREGTSFSGMFSLLWYPIVLVLVIIAYCAVVLPMTIKWWQKVPENRVQRDDSSRGRYERQPMMSGRPWQRPMGQDRGGRGRDQRFDRNRDRDRDRGRDNRDDRNRGRNDQRRDRTDSPRPQGHREDSPFAVSKTAHVFDPEAPAQAVPLPELVEERPAAISPEERPAPDLMRRDRPERSDRNDRGPRDRRDRRGGGGRDRDRQGRGGRDRGGRPDRPRRFEPQTPGDEPSTFSPAAIESDSDDFSGPSDLSRVFDPIPSNDREDREITETSRPERTQPVAPERPEYSPAPESTDESESEIAYGRTVRHRTERTEHEDSMPSEPTRDQETTDPALKPIDHYSNEGIEFGGRTKRKRMR